MLSPTVRSLVFRACDGAPFAFVAGQYVDLYVPGASGLVYKRPYSIASAPTHEVPGRFEIAVTRVEGGPTSEALHLIPVGARVEADPPRGGFRLVPAAPEETRLLVAAGTGLAPLRAMLEVDLAKVEGPRVALLFGCRTEEHVLWREDLEAWGRARGRFSFEVTLSRLPADWPGRVGYVQRHAAAMAHDLGAVQAYVCGLSKMVDEVGRELAGVGVAEEKVHRETYD